MESRLTDARSMSQRLLPLRILFVCIIFSRVHENIPIEEIFPALNMFFKRMGIILKNLHPRIGKIVSLI